jgi:bile acid-coenzyme A ligase
MSVMSSAQDHGVPVSYGRRLSALAHAHPDRTAIILVTTDGSEREITWRDLDQHSNRAARLLAERGVDERSLVAVAVPNSIEHYIATFAAWKLGALVLPLRAAVPAHERNQVLEAAQPSVVVGDWDGLTVPLVTADELGCLDHFSDAALPDHVPQPGFAIGSGGSTGRPKIIVSPAPMARVPGDLDSFPYWLGLRAGQVQLVPGPLYHTLGFSWSHLGLFEDHTLVVMERWNAPRVIDLIERHQVNFIAMVPSMMQRILKVPGWQARDFSSLQAIYHSGGICPHWLKRAWIELVGAENVFEAFGSTESVGHTVVRGDEWLARPGTVGRPHQSDIRILDDDGCELPPGEVGEIFMRNADGQPGHYYLGAPPTKTTSSGFRSVGDMGWLDADGYLYPADRRVDMIISGGANIYPAEVEAALADFPALLDAVVVGVPDEDWGRRVHAIVQPRDSDHPPSVRALDAHLRERIAAYKVPKTYEFVVELPRDESGKIRRSALATERDVERGS